MTSKETRVEIVREANVVIVRNDKGMTWEVPFKQGSESEVSVSAWVASAATNFLIGTIASIHYHTSTSKIKLSLKVETED